LVLAAKFRKPLPIVAGIFAATLVNHALAGAVGNWITTVLGPDVLRWILGISFILMAGWMLIPDKSTMTIPAMAPGVGVSSVRR
jgi:putative Ca2+/H+ antiporter (TMEM165/GDT1 family)